MGSVTQIEDWDASARRVENDMANLIVYYSRKGQNYWNGSIVDLAKGNTERVAEFSQKAVGGDLFEIETVREYSKDYMTCTEEAKAELRENARPELKKYLDANFAFTKEYLASHLPKARFTIPEATYLAWVDLSEYFTPDEDLPDFFAYKAGVLLEGGRMFVQNADGFIRLNLAMPRAMLAEGLKRISESVIAKAAK